jgi:hypothetical protein
MIKKKSPANKKPSMASPEQEFDFTKSKLQRLFIQELYVLCDQIERKALALFSDYPIISGEVFISSKIEGLELISSLLSCAAQVHDMMEIFKNGKLHRDRALFIQNILRGLSLSELHNKKVRNTIEHFSEYLDEANKKHTQFNSPQRYCIAFNLIISHWQPLILEGFPFQLYQTHQIKFPIYPVRIYIASEKKFYNMDWSINFDALYNEACLVKKHLLEQGYFKDISKPEDWISGFFVC